jgi:predicted DNA binding CopG/RHH family protein
MERDEKELIRIIRAWHPLFELEKEAYLMLPDELVFDVKDLARKYGVKIQILKMRRRTRYTFVAWVPRNKTDEEEEEEEDVEIVEKEDYDVIKEMVYEFVKQKKKCKVDDIKNSFSRKGISIGEDKIREVLRELHNEGRIIYNVKGVSLK